MLVLGRRIGQGIVITLPSGHEIRVKVVGKDRSRGLIHLGFEAAPDVRILRAELLTPDRTKEKS